VRCQADVDVVVAGVLHQVTLRKGGAGGPVAAIGADLLRDSQFAGAVECEDLVGAVGRRDREFSRADRVGARCLDRTVQLFAVLLHHEGEFVQRIFHQLRWEGIVGNQVKLLDQILLTQDHDRLTGCRRREHRHVAAACAADTADRVVGRDGLDRLGAIGRSDNDRQVILVKDLERVGEDRGRSVAVVRYPAGAAADRHLMPCSLSACTSSYAWRKLA